MGDEGAAETARFARTARRDSAGFRLAILDLVFFLLATIRDPRVTSHYS
jgi:hypothetical protein